MAIDIATESKKLEKMEAIVANMEEILMGMLSIEHKIEELRFLAQFMIYIHEDDDFIIKQLASNYEDR